ncbi:hypothetical protein EAX61_02605 [Dokdonia sinensis]|uniref:Uncharacterized protein n=2 Tax=Dokdonia sinensis TaxID=2479847 RepID=A0A3M0GDR4_9FLAO|nr:hypothetical protein EAX61_02605 [Dokdonia sinensis]
MVTIALAIAIFVLLILHFWSYSYTLSNNLSTENWYFRKLNFGEEKNAPSVFSTLLYVIISVLLFKIATSNLAIKKHNVFWISLGVIFLFLGADELLRIHEKIGGAFSDNVETSGIFYYSWVIPYGIALIILGIFIVKPLFSLPRRTLISFISAGTIFIIGAVGFEMMGGWYIDNHIIDHSTMYKSRPVFILYTIEELLEMIGLSAFIYALLRFQEKYIIPRP